MIQAAYLLSENRGLLVGYMEKYNYLWNTACQTDEKYMGRSIPKFEGHNFNLIYGCI